MWVAGKSQSNRGLHGDFDPNHFLALHFSIVDKLQRVYESWQQTGRPKALQGETFCHSWPLLQLHIGGFSFGFYHYG